MWRMQDFINNERATSVHSMLRSLVFISTMQSYSLMKLSIGKSLKEVVQMSVKAVLTRSLMSGRITAKPGFHVALIKRSNMRSVTT